MEPLLTDNNKSKIKALLLSGAKITVLSVLRMVNTIEARHYIAALRKEGMNIQDEWVKKNGKQFKTWWLSTEPKTIKN